MSDKSKAIIGNCLQTCADWGLIPTEFRRCMTWEEQVLWLSKFLQTEVIPKTNENIIKTKELEEWFDNLDIQEEVNNKLDEMAEDGTLEEIIGHYISDNYVTKQDFATTDTAGIVKPGDGLEVDAEGTISEKTFQQFIGVDPITTTYNDGDTSTKIVYAILPAQYKAKVVMADPDDPEVLKTASECDAQYMPTFMINAGAINTSEHYTYGPLIVDGEIEVQNNLGGGDDEVRTILTIDNAGVIESVNGATNASDIHTPYAVRAWHTLYNEGHIYVGSNDERAPRTFISQSTDGRTLIGVCGGRCAEDTGMLYSDINNFIDSIEFNPRVTFNLDGGGSSVFMYRGIRQNDLVANENRAVPNFIVFSSTTAKENGVFEAQSAASNRIIEISKKNTHTKDKNFYDNHKHENVTLQDQCVTRVAENGICTLTFAINVNSSGVAAYGALITDMPAQTTSALYFKGMKVSSSEANNTMHTFYLTRDNTTQLTKLITRFALTEGQYVGSISYPCRPQS